MDFDKALGLAVRMVRLSKGLTQEFFSVISSRTHISRLENGRKKPFVVTINDLAKAMGVHPLTVLTQAYLIVNPDINLEELHKLVQNEISKIDKT